MSDERDQLGDVPSTFPFPDPTKPGTRKVPDADPEDEPFPNPVKIGPRSELPPDAPRFPAGPSQP